MRLHRVTCPACEEGRILVHSPDWNDPYFCHDRGPCPECERGVTTIRDEHGVVAEHSIVISALDGWHYKALGLWRGQELSASASTEFDAVELLIEAAEIAEDDYRFEQSVAKVLEPYAPAPILQAAATVTAFLVAMPSFLWVMGRCTGVC